VSLSSSFLRARFNPLQFFNPLQGRNHKNSQPDASMHPSDAFSPLRTCLDKCYTQHFQCKSTTRKRKTLLRLTETEHISLFLLSLLYSNSSPHTDTFHAHKTLNLCSNSHIPQITTRTKTKLRENVTSQRHNRLRRSWIAGLASWHAHGGNFSNYKTLVLAARFIIDADR